MMDHFVVQYRPGSMGLDHSAWWIAQRCLVQGVYLDIPVKFLRQADYQ